MGAGGEDRIERTLRLVEDDSTRMQLAVVKHVRVEVESAGSTPGRRPMIRRLHDRKTMTARHPSQGRSVVVGAGHRRGHSDTLPT
jgi:hypothetical protein